MIQSMINEANVICRRFQQPYTFGRKEALTDGIQSVICIHDRDRHLVMHWSVEKMRQRLEVLREAIDESEIFPTDAIFERGDAWQLEDDASILFVPAIREKLGKLLKRSDSSMNVLDESRFSLDSSRRSSLLPRSPTFNAGIADTCKELVRKHSSGDLISTFCVTASALQRALDHPDRTPAFAIPLTVHAMSLLSIYPGLVQNMIDKRDVPSSIRSSWLQNTKELGERLQNSIEFVMQVGFLFPKVLIHFSRFIEYYFSRVFHWIPLAFSMIGFIIPRIHLTLFSLTTARYLSYITASFLVLRCYHLRLQ